MAGKWSTLRKLTLALCLAVAGAATTYGSLSFLASGTEVRAGLTIDRNGLADGAVDASFLESQAKLIESRDVLRRAAIELGVHSTDVLFRAPLQQRVLDAVGLGGAGKLVSPEERLTDALSARFSAVPSGRGRGIEVRFSAVDSDFAVRFVDRVVADYLVLQGTEGGVGARLVSGAIPVARTANLSPAAGAVVAAFLILALGGIGMGIGAWRRREVTDLPEDAPLAIGEIEARDPEIAEVEVPMSQAEDQAAAVSASAPVVGAEINLEGRRRVAVAGFGADEESRRLVDEIARERGVKGERIVVIDASRRASDRPGIAELLIGDADFCDVIQRNAASRAHEIGSGRRPLTALADDPQTVDVLLEALEQTYDLVLIDLGRLRADPAFALFARLAGQLMLTGDAEQGAVDTLLAALGRRGVTGIVRVAATASDIAA